MLHGTAAAILLRQNWTQQWRRTADPETIPGSPIADQSTGSNEVFLAAAVRLESGE
jgi:hypothetical protein